ncbi:MAG: hypothetical protein HQL82_08300 [Magnetococcales bacterium]|nr:hypothetical protein [Magnetococcales bacterium]
MNRTRLRKNAGLGQVRSAVVLLLLTACAPVPGRLLLDDFPDLTRSSRPATVAACRTLFGDLDRLVDRAGVRDAQEVRVTERPHLRVDRVLAAQGRLARDRAAVEAWLTLAEAADDRARRAELANLNLEPDVQRRMDQDLARCRPLLGAEDRGRPLAETQAWLADIAVPDEYRRWWRVAGLYWLTSLPIRAGVAELHGQIRATHRTAVDRLPVQGHLVTHGAATTSGALDADEVRRILREASRNPLGLPQPDRTDRDRLFAAFAPLWEVDVADPNDRLGRPCWGGEDGNSPGVDPDHPVVYQHLSHTFLDGRPLVQLNYVVWFPSRPARSAWDYLAGRIDGLTWRVTLGEDGRPLLFDTIHNCGCYHLFFPTLALAPVGDGTSCSEPALVPTYLGDLSPGERVILRVSSVEHFVTHVRIGRGAALRPSVTLVEEEYGSLRSLPRPDGRRRSLFDDQGLVVGSERGERWLFWPMGIPGPGTMRQWGHHATAFFGKRHFDDADLIQRYFMRQPLNKKSTAANQSSNGEYQWPTVSSR